MSDKVQCATHGETDATYVCCHIVNSLDAGKAVGFYSPADSDGVERPNAWVLGVQRGLPFRRRRVDG